ncbi:MAG: M23 family metallopeptidase [Aquificae bacterium]|nr:M23 family metallopeptidase [Aquificota bacterium]
MRKLTLTALLLALLLAAGGTYLLYEKLRVEVFFKPEYPRLGLKSRVHLEVKPSFSVPFGEVEVFVRQGNASAVLYEGPIAPFAETLIFEPKKAGFRDGEAEVVGVVRLPFKEERIFYQKVVVDLTPPTLEVVRKPRYLKVGEPGVLTLKSSEELLRAQIRFGEAVFPLLEVEGGTYKTVVTVPLFALEEPQSFYAEAVDAAGNEVRKFVPLPVRLVKFRTVKVEFDRQTLQELLLKFFNSVEDPAAQFRIVNEEFRREDQRTLVRLAQNSTDRLLAKGAFKQLPGSAVTARYGDHRLYYFEGKKIGESYHGGLDLAKYRHAPVVAANDGRVVFAGRLKIYGNAVVIDHGFGVLTLYGHLLDYSVKVGQTVKKGEVIGRTDTTGFALGDHLHFATLVWGYAANPIYFFDGNYLKYHFYEPLR